MSSASYSAKSSGELNLIIGVMYAGKCLAPDTPVLMFDGTVKAVQDVIPGEQLMGDDSSARNVLSICSGESEMFKVSPSFGDPYIVNEHHILSLKCSFAPEKCGGRDARKHQKGEVINIPVKDFIKESDAFKSYYKGYRVGVDFEEKPVSMDPYILGAWLGDGAIKEPSSTAADLEIFEEIKRYADGLGLRAIDKNATKTPARGISGSPNSNSKNPFTTMLEDMGVSGDKHVPLNYKSNTREIRLQLLAGMIDAGGRYTGKGYDVIQKSKRLADDTAFLARSLGMTACVDPCQRSWPYNGVKKTNTYHRMTIEGKDLHQIPCRLACKKAEKVNRRDNLLAGINVESIGRGKYHGFEIDGNHLFLLGDFTVTHNTTELLRRLFNETEAGLKCIYINHEKDTRSEAPFSTHNPLYKKQLSRESGVLLVSAKRVRDVNVEEYSIVGIDEAHFFDTDLVCDVIDLVDNKNKTVIVAGLNGDMKRNNIGYIVGLIPHMDSCTYLTAYCKRCAEARIKRDAVFSYKFGAGDDVGGADKYIPLCRSCYNEAIVK